MAKKSSASSRHGKRISVRSENIFNKALDRDQEAVLKRIAAKQKAGEDSDINYKDIPPLSEEQLANSVIIRPNRAREFVGVRLDTDVLFWLKQFGPGHSTRINRILRAVMENEQERQRSKTGPR